MIWSGAGIKRCRRARDRAGRRFPRRGIEGAIKVLSPRAGLLNRGPWFTRSPPEERRESTCRRHIAARGEALPPFGDT